jgi:uncharacterized protein
MKLTALIGASLALFAACAISAARFPAWFSTLELAEVRAETASGTHRFRVWVADDEKSREQGLMFVRELPPGRGMLFVFEAPQQAAFWMKDTYLSLDLIFVDADGRVANIAAHAKPLSLDPILSRGLVIAVLEVPAGTAGKIALAPGDQVVLPTLRTTS